jgi:hypothetical protein
MDEIPIAELPRHKLCTTCREHVGEIAELRRQADYLESLVRECSSIPKEQS